MSLEAEKTDDFNKRRKKLLPWVHTREGTFIFNPVLIYQSLRKETIINSMDA